MPADVAGDDPLGPLLAVLADEAHRQAGAVRAGIVREFSAAVSHARRHASRHELAGILRALKDRRRAALAVAKRNAALELAGRRQAAIAARRRTRPCIRSGLSRDDR